MGARHVAAAYANWSHLQDPAFRLLVYMALVAKDANDKPRFWGGRRTLAFGIARGVADDEELPKATVQAVKRCIKTLTDAGAIRGVYGGFRGKNMEYELNLNGPRKGYAPRTPSKSDSAGERGTPRDPERGTPRDPNGVRPVVQRGTPHVPPRSTKEYKEQVEEELSPPTGPSPTAGGDETTDEGMNYFEARRIIRAAMDAGIVIDELIQGKVFRNRTERAIFTATEIVRTRSAS